MALHYIVGPLRAIGLESWLCVSLHRIFLTRVEDKVLTEKLQVIDFDITGLYQGSLHQRNLKGYKVNGFLSASERGAGPCFVQFVSKLRAAYLVFTPFATML